MAFNCGVSFGACMVRITKLDENGNVIAGQNSYVSDKLVSVGVSPNNEAGDSFTVRSGCGCSIARRRFPDTFNWWELALSTAGTRWAGRAGRPRRTGRPAPPRLDGLGHHVQDTGQGESACGDCE